MTTSNTTQQKTTAAGKNKQPVQMKDKISALKLVCENSLAKNFDTFFHDKPELKKAFFDSVYRLAIINPEIIAKYTPMQLAPALLKAAEMRLLPDGNECAIVVVGNQPACWLMAAGAHKRIMELPNVLHCSVECIYSNEQVIYDKFGNKAPIVKMADGKSFFDKGVLIGAIGYVELEGGYIILQELSVDEAPKYKPNRKTWHYSDDWMPAFMVNITTKLLYKKLPKQTGRPANIWDDTDKSGDAGGNRLGGVQTPANMDAEGAAIIVADSIVYDETTLPNEEVSAPAATETGETEQSEKSDTPNADKGKDAATNLRNM